MDQLLLQLCQNLATANDAVLAEGKILRLGHIEHDELIRSFSEFITVEAIVARKSKTLVERKAEVEAELQRLGHAVARAQQILANFHRLDAAQNEVTKAERALAELTTRAETSASLVQASANRLLVFEDELRARATANAVRRMFLRSEVTIQKDITAERSKRTTLDPQLSGEGMCQ